MMRNNESRAQDGTARWQGSVPPQTIALPKCRMIRHNSGPCSRLIAFPSQRPGIRLQDAI